MTTTVTCYVRQARPSDNEVEAFWKLYRAADRIDSRWGGFTIPDLNEELQKTAPDDWNVGIDRAHRLFLLRAYQVLVCQGGFGRFMGAFDTMAHNMQDPNADTVDWKPEIKTALMDGDILPVVLEAYEEAQADSNARSEALDRQATALRMLKTLHAEIANGERLGDEGYGDRVYSGYVITHDQLDRLAELTGAAK